MTVRRLAEDQPESFAFTPVNIVWAEKEIAKYPEGRQASAVISLLWRAQEQEGWVTEPAIETIAAMLDMPKIRVLEVATFYTMFHLEPVGRIAHLQVCGTTPCWLRGAENIKDVCRKRINAQQHHLSADGAFSWEEVECLGACVNAPLVQIGADTFEDLTPESLEALIDDLASGKAVKPGPQVDRQFAAPEGDATSLTDPALYDPALRAEAKAKEDASAAADAGESPVVVSEGEPRPEPESGESAKTAPPEEKDEVEAATGEQTDAVGEIAGTQPEGLPAARDGKSDDLKRISGVGPKIEGILHSLGIFHFDQIASWQADHIAWVDERLKFKGRITRENWIDQAKALAGEGRTGGDDD